MIKFPIRVKAEMLLVCAALVCLEACHRDPNRGLIEAAKKGDANAVKKWLDAGADIKARDDEMRATALCFAAWYGHGDVVRSLVRAGADPNDTSQCGDIALIGRVIISGTSVLMFASRNGHVGAIQALVEAGADVNAKNLLGHTPLMVAAYYNQLEAVKALVKAGADVSAKDAGGNNALERASAAGNSAIVDYLKDVESKK